MSKTPGHPILRITNVLTLTSCNKIYYLYVPIPCYGLKEKMQSYRKKEFTKLKEHTKLLTINIAKM